MPDSPSPSRPRSRTLALIATSALAVVLAAALVASYLPTGRSSPADGVVKIGNSPTFNLDLLTGAGPASSSLDGRQLPDATLATLAGSAEERVRLAKAGGGRPLVVNIWSSTCIPCQRETPAFVAVWRDLKERDAGVSFVGVDVQDTAAAGLAFLRRYGATDAYPMLSDPSATVAFQLGATALPTTLLVDPSGRVVAGRFGALTSAELRALLHDHFGIIR